MRRKNLFLKKMLSKFIILAMQINLFIGMTFQNKVQAIEVPKTNKVPVILIHGRTDNSEKCWGAANSIKEGTNYEFDISKDRDNYYTNVSNQKISEKSLMKDNYSTQLASALKKAGYTENEDLFIFNYPNIDFVEKNAGLLKEYIQNLIKEKFNNSQNQQFDLVGHSMGGLVSRYYIENLNGSNTIRKLITIDTPHWGSELAWPGVLKEAKFAPCDNDDLNPQLSGLFNENRAHTSENQKKVDTVVALHYVRNNQSHALKLEHGNVKYYAIAGINRWIGAPDTGSMDNIIDLKTDSYNGINSDKDIIDKFINWEGGKSDIFRQSYLSGVLPTLGDNIVNLYSQIGWGNIGIDGKPEKQVAMYKISVNVDEKFGNNAYYHLHSENQHRKAVIDRTIEYLNDGNTNNENSNTQIITFADKNLEQAIRSAIDKPTGDLYKNDVENITELKIESKDIKIKNISGIENLTNLEILWLGYYNEVSDISALKGLTKLRGLNLHCNKISDISALQELTNLEYLGLEDNQISDISALKGLTKLYILGLSNNQISDISALKGLTKLIDLRLSENQISDISELKGLTNLVTLYLKSTQIKDISVLKGLTNLTTLDLSNNQIEDISVLKWLTKLRSLDLDGKYANGLLTNDISAINGGDIKSYKSGENVTISGTVRELKWKHPTSGNMTTYLLELDTPSNFDLTYYDGNREELKGVNEIQIAKYSSDSISKKVNQHVSLKGQIEASQPTAYYHRPVAIYLSKDDEYFWEVD